MTAILITLTLLLILTWFLKTGLHLSYKSTPDITHTFWEVMWHIWFSMMPFPIVDVSEGWQKKWVNRLTKLFWILLAVLIFVAVAANKNGSLN